MKAVVLAIVAVLCWQHGYSRSIKEKNIFIERTNAVFLNSVPSVAWTWKDAFWSNRKVKKSHLGVVLLDSMKVEPYQIQQIYSAYVSSMGKRINYMAILPEVVAKNRVGIYIIYMANSSRKSQGCALYDGSHMVLPPSPEVKRTGYSMKVPVDIYQARLEVVEAFLKKHDYFTKAQKQDIVITFTNGYYLPPLHGRIASRAEENQSKAERSSSMKVHPRSAACSLPQGGMSGSR